MVRDKSGEFTIYKKLGAAQFKILPVKENQAGYVGKSGAILLQAAPGNGQGRELSWDWDAKITFAIGIADICRLAEDFDSPPKCLHEQDGNTKTLEFVPGTGNFEGTYMMKLFQKNRDGTKMSVQVPLSGGEYMVLVKMMLAVTPHLVGWLE